LFQNKTVICFKLKHSLHLPNEKPTHFASTLPKPHEPRLQPKLCQRAFNASPRKEFQNFPPRLKEEIQTRHHTGETDITENEVVI